MHDFTLNLRAAFAQDWLSWTTENWPGASPDRVATRDALLLDRRFARPLVCLATAVDGNGSLPLATSLARVCQLLHVSSCMLDDLPSFDDSSHRNSRPAMHTRYGEDVVILIAIRILNEAFGQVSRWNQTRVGSVVQTVEAMIQGQLLSVGSKGSLEERMLKCGALFALATSLGEQAACVKDVGPQAEIAGRCIGLLYQEIDDTIDDQATDCRNLDLARDIIDSKIREIPEECVALRRVANDILIEKFMSGTIEGERALEQDLLAESPIKRIWAITVPANVERGN